MQDDGYKVGRRGGSVFSTNDSLGWARGDMERKFEQAQEGLLEGESHPHALQLVILAALIGIPVTIFTHRGVIPWGPYVSAGIGVAGFAASYYLLRRVPGWLSGALMGLLLGGGAAYLGWTEGDIYWAGGAGTLTALLMYFLFSRLN
ncbi:MAG: hypothetical protein KJO38_00855 [Gammaproteobacteria bacterium]|nr:hypothetical protein [Gammaproteobacteria bacterium]